MHKSGLDDEQVADPNDSQKPPKLIPVVPEPLVLAQLPQLDAVLVPSLLLPVHAPGFAVTRMPFSSTEAPPEGSVVNKPLDNNN